MSVERRGVQNLNRKHCSHPTSIGGTNGLQESFSSRRPSNCWMRIGLAAQKKDLVFNGLFNHFTAENLREAFRALNGSKAVGIDGVSKNDYAGELEKNLKDLETRLHKGTYRPQAKKEILIPKGDGRTRPIAISCFEDKMVEWVLGRLLQLVYEPLFSRNSFGFRPRKSCHDAIKACFNALKDDGRPYVVEIDMANFFNTVSHKKLMRVVQMRVKERRMSGLIARFLKTKISLKGKITTSQIGTPQGSVMSPMLANIYLNHVIDQWFEKHYAPTGARMVRYADDAVFMFAQRKDAEEFLTALEERLENFQLVLNAEKTKIVDFSKDKRNIFGFLGFTFYWGKRVFKRRSSLMVKTEKKQFFKKVEAFKEWLKEMRNVLTTKNLLRIVASKLRGHYNYYGIKTNQQWVAYFYNKVLSLLYKWLNRRSQRKSISWDKLTKLRKKHLPQPPKNEKLTSMEKAYVW